MRLKEPRIFQNMTSASSEESEMRLVWPTSLCYNCLLPKLHNKLRKPYNKKQFSLWYLRYFKCWSSSFTKCKSLVSPMASLSNLSNKREHMIFPLGVEKICLRSILHCIVTKMVLTKVYKKRRESEQFTLLAFFPLLL